MPMEYGSRQLEVRRPPSRVGLIQIAGSLIVLVLILISGFFNYRAIGGSIQIVYDLLTGDGFGRGETIEIIGVVYSLALGIFALFFLPAVFKSLAFAFKQVIRGVSELVTPWMPANIPGPYQNYEEVKKGFRERTLSIYQTSDPFVSGLFGANTMFLSPARRKVVKNMGDDLKGTARRIGSGMLLLALILGFFYWIPTDSARVFLVDLGKDIVFLLMEKTARNKVIAAVIVLIALYVLNAGIEIAAIFFLVPKKQPVTIAHEGTEHFRGFGHPDQVLSRLPDLARTLEWSGFHNRVHSSWGEKPSPSVENVGAFSGNIIIEQQPRPMETVSDLAAFVSLGAGWLLYLAGIYIYLFRLIPSLIYEGGIAFLYAPLFVLLMGIAASQAVKNGTGMIDNAMKLFMSVRFQSTAILMDLTGTLSRADVKIGKSIADSIESSSVVVRSDFTANFYSAELISEASQLDAERDLLAMEKTQEALEWIDFFREGIEILRDEGVKPVGIDLSAEEVKEIVQANIGISAHRSGAIERAQLEVAHGGEEPLKLLEELHEGEKEPEEEIDQASEAEPEVDQSAEYKECPDCAEMVRARARKCRFCGYRFDEQES